MDSILNNVDPNQLISIPAELQGMFDINQVQNNNSEHANYNTSGPPQIMDQSIYNIANKIPILNGFSQSNMNNQQNINTMSGMPNTMGNMSNLMDFEGMNIEHNQIPSMHGGYNEHNKKKKNLFVKRCMGRN